MLSYLHQALYLPWWSVCFFESADWAKRGTDALPLSRVTCDAMDASRVALGKVVTVIGPDGTVGYRAGLSNTADVRVAILLATLTTPGTTYALASNYINASRRFGLPVRGGATVR